LPSEKPLLRLEDILENIERIELYVRDYGFQDFADDGLCRDAVERCLLRISEAARKLEDTLESLAPDQPWPAIRAIGNVLRHEYDAIDPAIIWEDRH
jgi:uncharacterized protein with HEPN domain